ALFVTHFAHWENAIWIGTMSDLVLAFFILTALLAYDRFRRGGSRWAYAVALGATAGALLSKEAAVAVAPMIFPADIFIRPESQTWRSRLAGALRRTAPFWLLSFFLVLLVLVSGMVERYSSSASLSLFGRHVPRHAAGYLAWMLFPFQTAGNVPGV